MKKPFTPAVLTAMRTHEMLAVLPEEHRFRVFETSQPAMVDELAKPGADIVASLDAQKFERIAQVCAQLISAGNLLDAVKKLTIYGKEVPTEADFVVPADLTNAFNTLTDSQAHLLHMAIGAAGEATELLNAVCAHVFSEQSLDVKNLVEEAGDTGFYIHGILNEIKVSQDEVNLDNRIKLLGKRFAKGYSDKAAQERADKA